MDGTDFWINNIKVYFDYLYKLNIDYIKLIGTEYINIRNEYIYGEIVDDISKLIPVSVNEKKRAAYINQDRDDGIIDLLGNNYEFVRSTLNKIVKENNDTLYNIKVLRNKIEHNPHRLMGSTEVSANGVFNINFGYLARDKKFPIKSYKDIELENHTFNSKEIQKIIVELNKLYSNIQEKLKEELEKYDEAYKNNDYFKECLNIDYNEFNDLYSQQNFNLVCKLINKSIISKE